MTTTLKLSEAQVRVLAFCLDIGRMELEQLDEEELKDGFSHFQRSIEAIENKLGIVA
jgi:hypothetical protein